ncbi:diguanylate cyclase (GGDEF)-like protein [Motilibacter rhizosphaerae]|uniref:Diguanylate cyclase (GGDEF)-like protein n=1 Tax=Motilibacter rhizosphaerae TaxID=598652 RepID=A0A4Q7NTX8_9ACTN|nr:bifunctional diguanylate cyclase/phosphodiesterase [Motilibacter rhizosphaerae]RZS90288.1 diguanylate cyclase (GGDEF)-like protein [Motilibacter rhizosphaerae]
MGGGDWQAAVAVQYALAGATLLVALLHLLWWRRRPEERSALWSGLLSLSAAVLLASGAALFDTGALVHVQTLLLVRTAAIAAVTVLAVVATRVGAGLPPARLAVTLMLALYAVRFVLWGTTHLVYAHRVDRDGFPVYGPLVVLSFVPVVLVVVWLTLDAARRSSSALARRALVGSVLAAVLIAAVADTTGSRRLGELLSALWVTPFVAAQGMLVVLRLVSVEASERRLLSRQSALAAFGGRAVGEDDLALLEADAVRVVGELVDAPVSLQRRPLGTHPAAVPQRRLPPGQRQARGVRVGGSREELEASWEGELAPEDVEVVESVLHVLSAGAERAAAEEELRRLAVRDALTGLPNRALLQDRLASALGRAGRTQDVVAVLFFGLDGLKRLNDTAGHAAGDAALVQVGSAVARAARSTDTAARFGSDEFVLLCEGDCPPARLLEIAQHVRAEVARLDLPGPALTASAGIAASPAGEGSPEDLLRDAHAALQRAKERGTGVETFGEGLRRELLERVQLESDLDRDVPDRLEVHYQPVVRTADGRPVSVEALVRWRRDGELLLPGAWLEVAEQTGRIVAVGEAVLRRACADASRLRLPVAVNVSARQLASPGFAELVESLAVPGGVPLVLEVTETAVIADVEGARRLLERVRAAGVRVAMDDFGTGWSSLGMLSRLPVDVLKIDRSFVARVDEPDGRALVETVLLLGTSLGLDVVAEGVETEEQLEVLRSLGCSLVQGFLTGRPQPVERLLAAVADGGATAARGD